MGKIHFTAIRLQYVKPQVKLAINFLTEDDDLLEKYNTIRDKIKNKKRI